jgi:hypothetical protein
LQDSLAEQHEALPRTRGQLKSAAKKQGTEFIRALFFVENRTLRRTVRLLKLLARNLQRVIEPKLKNRAFFEPQIAIS